MNILLIAPHPFYQERGTPIAVDLLVRTLADLGHHVDILTFPEGETRDYGPLVRLYRIDAPPGCRNIRPGFSLKKLRCDLRLLPAARRLCRENRYDRIHAVEEASFVARRLSRETGIPYIFDMDSSMPIQIADKIPLARLFLPLMRAIERPAIRDAEAVVPVCDAIADLARAAGAKRIEILRDISLLPTDVPPDPARGFRAGPPPIEGTTLLYVGNLETYQGIDLLLDAFALAAPEAPDATLVIVGGRPDDLARYRARAAALPGDLPQRIHFLGPRPVADMPYLFHDADILVSPRTQGNNTPMKIYSYLDSSRPILATDLPTHTQVLTPGVALLAPPRPRPFADALLRLLRDPALRSSLATSAKSLATARHTLPAYRTTLSRLYPAALRAERRETRDE